MEESFIFQCPECQRDLTLPLRVAGRTGKCPKCKEVISIPAATSTDFDTAQDLDIYAGESTIDLPRPNSLKEPQEKVADELKKLLDELDGD